MRIIIITQNEPFYLKNNLEYLIKIFPKDCELVGCVVNEASPFGKKSTFIKKAIKTYNIFGFNFFIHYSFKYIKSFFSKSITRLLSENNIPIINIEGSINSQKSLNTIQDYNPDVLVSILGNQIFKKPLIDLAPKGCINLHTALLPKYRGLMPTFWVMKNNEKYTGVSVFFVDEGIDSGPIIIQEKVNIKNLTQEEIIIKTKKIGMELISKSISLIQKDEIILIENNASESSYFSFPTKEDVLEFKRIGKKFF